VSLLERSHFVEISLQLGSKLQQQCFVSSSAFNLSAAWLLLMNLIILLLFIKIVTTRLASLWCFDFVHRYRLLNHTGFGIKLKLVLLLS